MDDKMKREAREYYAEYFEHRRAVQECYDAPFLPYWLLVTGAIAVILFVLC